MSKDETIATTNERASSTTNERASSTTNERASSTTNERASSTINERASSTTFADLNLRPESLKELTDLGYEEPTPIQAEAIPVMMAGKDILGQAATGTGKTAAFALPILERLSAGTKDKDPIALILVPTRELAMQVSEAIHRYGRKLGARVVPVYGGQPIFRQLQSLERGTDVIVGTPGRIVDHINRKSLKLDKLEVVVLDEADEMLDMGFAEEIEAILKATPKVRQTVLFSATMPRRLDAIARKHLNDPVRVEIARAKAVEGEAPKVRQAAYIASRNHKAAAIGRLLDVEAPAAALVFCRTREQVDTLTETLNGRGYRAEALHGGMDQAQRDRVMGRLRNETADLLIATDVAARGLDIDHLTHVINYDVPASPDTYVHRIGRVGRAGREGVAITLAEPREHRMLKTIERVTKQTIAIETLPTISELRARRVDLTTAALRESLQNDKFDEYQVVVDTLANEFDLTEIAVAAIKMAHEATNTELGNEEIPQQTIDLRDSKNFKGGRESGGSSGGYNKKRAGGQSAGMTKVFVGAGKGVGVRPQDLVGAIANESSLSGKQIGGIDIQERFSLVEVPDSSVDEVIAVLRKTTIKGKKATIRRERFGNAGGK